MSYILDEALNTLHEAFSDSVPHWFRTRLQYSTKPNAWGISQKLMNKNPDLASQRSPMYGSRYSGETNLLNLLKSAGYDPSSFSVVEMEVPQSLQDEVFSNPDALPVFHIVTNNDDKVWVQGINDNEKFFDDDNKEQAFKYMNNAKLKKYVKDFAYIDLAAPETHQSDLTLSRDRLQGRIYSGKPIGYSTTYKGVLSNPELGSRRFDPAKDTGSSSLFDKSGYFRGAVAGELSARLKKELAKIQNKKIPKRVLELEKQILNLQGLLNQYLSQTFDYDQLSGVDTYMFGDEQKSVLTKVGNLIRYWEDTQQHLDRDLRQDPNRESFSRNTESALNDTIQLFNELSEFLDKYKTTYFTW